MMFMSPYINLKIVQKSPLHFLANHKAIFSNFLLCQLHQLIKTYCPISNFKFSLKILLYCNYNFLFI